jgi:hypothetical protein
MVELWGPIRSKTAADFDFRVEGTSRAAPENGKISSPGTQWRNASERIERVTKHDRSSFSPRNSTAKTQDYRLAVNSNLSFMLKDLAQPGANHAFPPIERSSL